MVPGGAARPVTPSSPEPEIAYSEVIRRTLSVSPPVGLDREALRNQVRCVRDVIDGQSRRPFQVPFGGDFEALERPPERRVNALGIMCLIAQRTGPDWLFVGDSASPQVL